MMVVTVKQVKDKTMEVTFITSTSGKTKYWGVQDGEVFLQTSTKKAAVVLLNHLLKLKENYDGLLNLQSDLSNDLLSEQVDSSPTSSSSQDTNGLRTDDIDGCSLCEKEQRDPGLEAIIEAGKRSAEARKRSAEARKRSAEARERYLEARERTNSIVSRIVDDYSRLVNATAKASLRSSSNDAKYLEPETIDVDVVK